jgi:hypothetical protein
VEDIERTEPASGTDAQSAPQRPRTFHARNNAPTAREDESLRFRASGLIFLLVSALTIAWLIPSDWGFHALVGLVLVSVSLVTSWFVVFQAAQLLVDEPATEVVRALFGHRLSVRSKSRFLQRVQHECTDAQLRARNRGFSLVVLRFPAALWTLDFNEPLPNIIEVVRSRVRSRDVLGDLGSGELWVLALGAGAEAAESLTTRLSNAIAREVPQIPAGLRSGWSTFATDAHDVKHLLAAARNRAGYGDPDAELSEAA